MRVRIEVDSQVRQEVKFKEEEHKVDSPENFSNRKEDEVEKNSIFLIGGKTFLISGALYNLLLGVKEEREYTLGASAEIARDIFNFLKGSLDEGVSISEEDGLFLDRLKE